METLNSEAVYFLTSELMWGIVWWLFKKIWGLCVQTIFENFRSPVVSLWVCTITWWFLLDSSNTKATYRRFFWLAAFRVVRILHGRESWAAGDSHGAEVSKIHCVLLGQFVQMKDLAFIGLIKCFLSLWIQVHPFC